MTAHIHYLKPQVYCASPLHRARMWRGRDLVHDIDIISTWHENLSVEDDDQKPALAYAGWLQNMVQLKKATHLLVYAEHKDRPNGTLVEIGAALARPIPVYLVGNHKWGSWSSLCRVVPTLREAIFGIINHNGVKRNDPS